MENTNETKKAKYYLTIGNDEGFINGYNKQEINIDNLLNELDSMEENGDYASLFTTDEVDASPVGEFKFSDDESWVFAKGWWYGFATNFSNDEERIMDFIKENL